MLKSLSVRFVPIVVRRDQQVVLTDGMLADSFFTRLQGLMFRSRLSVNEGLLLTHCRGVHTFGMRFVIDIVFLDADGMIVGAVPDFGPNRFARCSIATHTLELAARSIQRLRLRFGQTLICQSRACGEASVLASQGRRK